MFAGTGRVQAMRSRWHIGFCRNQDRPPAFVVTQRCAMPAWMEILINVIGYAGFIGIATYHKSPSNNSPEQ
jgi:hypothetical protein